MQPTQRRGKGRRLDDEQLNASSSDSSSSDSSSSDQVVSDSSSKSSQISSQSNSTTSTQSLATNTGPRHSVARNDNSQVNRNSILNSLSLENDLDLQEEFSISDMNNKAKSKEFPLKVFLIGDILKHKTAVLHFYNSIRILSYNASQKNNNFTCKFCNIIKVSTFADCTNLYKHLKLHKAFLGWYELYEKRKNVIKPAISKEVFLFIKFICSSNLALNQLKNPFLVELLRHSFKVPSYRTTRNTLLPEVYGKLFQVIERKLKGAKTVSLMADIWTNGIMKDYIGIAASLGFDMSNKELLVIGFGRMPSGSTTSEQIKEVMEEILNKFSFDKSKISCKFI